MGATHPDMDGGHSCYRIFDYVPARHYFRARHRFLLAVLPGVQTCVQTLAGDEGEYNQKPPVQRGIFDTLYRVVLYPVTGYTDD